MTKKLLVISALFALFVLGTFGPKGASSAEADTTPHAQKTVVTIEKSTGTDLLSVN